MGEKFIIEDNKSYEPDRDSCVGNVENRLEKQEVAASDKWNP